LYYGEQKVILTFEKLKSKHVFFSYRERSCEW